MKIIKGTDSISVEHPVFLIFGQPGIGKSSLGYSTKDPLLLDFDKGAHRAANRRDSLVIDGWKDVLDRGEVTMTTCVDSATCERCGKKHVTGWVYLELNLTTNTWHKPGDVPAAQSQGLFRFGIACARRALGEK